MNNLNMLFGVTNIGLSLLIMVVGLPLARRKVPMNRVYGIRIPKSFASEANWYAINAYGGRQFMLWSLLPLLAGCACFFVRLDAVGRDIGPLLGGAPAMLACLLAVIQSLRFARKL